MRVHVLSLALLVLMSALVWASVHKARQDFDALRPQIQKESFKKAVRSSQEANPQSDETSR